jgi:hypothetical protein
MVETFDGSAAGRQRALLEQLVALSDQQEYALDSGDMDLLMRLSQLRGKVVGDAAPYLPPQMAWDAELAGLVTHVQERSEDLQQSIRACMAVVRRDLAALTHNQQVTRYLTDAIPSGAGDGTWTA